MFRLHPLMLAVGAVFSSSVLAAEALQLDAMEINADALGRSAHEMATAVTALSEEDLLTRRASTIGEMIDGLPGVRSSSFGPGVGRPVIRGMEGPRVKVLNDGSEMMDASSISPDHAVSVDGGSIERIEVLRGPAALLYGSGAMGGVVNVIDGRIPTYVPEKGYEGVIDLRANSVANAGAGFMGITAGKGPFAVRVEGSKERAKPYRIPGAGHKQENSFNNMDSYSLGTSLVLDRGYLGVAYSEQNKHYGLLAHEHADCHTHGPSDWHCMGEDDHGHGHGGHDHDHDEHHGDPYIKLRQKRWDLRGELADPLAGFERARIRVGHSTYRHDEMEGGEVGTRFDSRATDGRFELTHQPIAGWRGTLGWQGLRRDFNAEGEEAFVPPSLTHANGVFLLEEYVTGDWRYELGLRHDWQRISAQGHDSAKHNGNSVSAGVVWSFIPDYALGLSLSRSQRLPTAEELYANGPHAATHTVELGDANLKRETSKNIELSLRKLAGDTTFDLSLYRNDFNDYIYGAETGRDIGAGFRELQYRQNKARFIGLEGSLRQLLTHSAALVLFGEHVRGKLLNHEGWVPRLPSDRLGVRWEQAFSQHLDGNIEFSRTQRQTHVARHETETAGYNLLGAGLVYRGAWEASDYQLYAKVDNLMNTKYRNSTSFIKDEVLQPGRNFTVGARFNF